MVWASELVSARMEKWVTTRVQVSKRREKDPRPIFFPCHVCCFVLCYRPCLQSLTLQTCLPHPTSLSLSASWPVVLSLFPIPSYALPISISSSPAVTVSPDLPALSPFLVLNLRLTHSLISLPLPVLSPYPSGCLLWTKITIRVLESFAIMYEPKCIWENFGIV